MAYFSHAHGSSKRLHEIAKISDFKANIGGILEVVGSLDLGKHNFLFFKDEGASLYLLVALDLGGKSSIHVKVIREHLPTLPA